MEITDLLKVLWRRRWILITIPILAALVAFVVKKNMPQSYKSTAQLATGFTTENPLQMEEQKFNAYESSIKFNNLIEMIKSKLVISLVSYNLMLHDMTSDEPFRVVDLSELDDMNSISAAEVEKMKELFQDKLKDHTLLTSFSEEENKLIKLLKAYEYDYESIIENLNIWRLGQSDFISIEFISENPELSAYMVNKLSEEFIAYNKSLQNSRASESVDFYANLVAEKKQVLEEKRETLKAYKSSNSVLNFNLESESKVKQINDLEKARDEERQKIYGLDLALREVNNKLSQIENNQNATNNNIIKIRNRINELNSQYRNSGSSNNSLKDSIDVLRSMLQAEMVQVSAVVTPEELKELKDKKSQLRIDLAVAQSSSQSINNTLNDLKNNVSGFANKEANINELEREVEEASQEYQKTLEKYNSAKNTSLMSSGSIQQVLEGQPAGEPEAGKTLIIAALSGIASFAFCAAIILGIAFLDSSIKNPKYFNKIVDIPLLGYLNELPQNKRVFFDMINSTGGSEEIIKFNHLLKKIRFEIESSEDNVFLVTSTKQGEGKTFVIASIAYALSLTNKKVLLIDTNFKNNSLTQLFISQTKDQKKLEEHSAIQNRGAEIALLNEGSRSQESKDEDFFSKGLISKTMLKNIDIIGSKGGNYSPSEIFSKKNFKFLVEELSFKYDYIILEGTSLNEYSDSKELIEYVDKVIPVFSALSGIQQADKESINYLRKLNGQLLGGVLNKVKTEDMS